MSVPYTFGTNAYAQSGQLDANFASLTSSLGNIDASQITTGILPVARGGTGAGTAPAALTSLGAVAKAGDTMTGGLVMGSPAGGNLGPGTINAAGSIQSAGNIYTTAGFLQAQGSTAGLYLYDRSNSANSWLTAVNSNIYSISTNSPTSISCAQIYLSGGGTSGVMRMTGGYAAQPGLGAAQKTNVHNIDWTGTAQLWIDTSNIGTIAFTSDYRIKENIQPLGSKWDAVKALRPISYTIKDNEELLSVADPAERWGFLAHELQETLIERAASGRKDVPNERQAPDPWVMLAAVVSALQEAQTRIEALEKR